MRRSAAPSRCIVKAVEKRPGVDISSRLSVQEPVENLAKKSDVQLAPDESSVSYYEAMYAKVSSKKHKKWKGDGFVVVSGRAVKLISESGKTLSSGSGHKLSFLSNLDEGSLIKIGGFEAELVSRISSYAYRSKAISVSDNIIGAACSDNADSVQFRSLSRERADC